MSVNRSLSEVFSATPCIVDDVSEPIDRGEVLRYLGYPVDVLPQPQILESIDRWIGEAAALAKTWAVSMVFPVAAVESRRLVLETSVGSVAFRGAIGEFLGASQYIAAFIATAGPDIEQAASKLLAEGDELAAMVLNAVGAERAEAAEAAAAALLRSRAASVDFALTLPYSPGYCGMALTEQRTLFSLFEDVELRVSLTSSCMMRPIKSISGLIGIGPSADVKDLGSPCERCELHTCAMRR